MKGSWLANFLLALTAFAPASFIYGVVWFIERDTFGVIVCILTGLSMVVVCCVIVRKLKKDLQTLPYHAIEVEPADNEILAYLIVYMFPLITNEYSTDNWVVWIGVAIAISLLVAKAYGNQFNPVLTALGWHYFKVTDKDGRTSILITKNKMYSPKDVIPVGKITEYVLLDKS